MDHSAPSHHNAMTQTDKTKSHSLLTDTKELFKGIVLIANVLPVFTGFWLALAFNGYHFADYWGLFLLTMIGSSCVMAGALLINNWYDVDIDKIMKRTQKRPTVTGHISLHTVLALGIGLSVIGLGLLAFTTVEALLYAVVGWVVYVVFYTMWSKRRYTLNTVIGSVSGAVTPMIGWAAIGSTNHIVPIMLFLLLFIWQVPHTFATAIKKYDEYKAANVPMLPVTYGFAMTKRQMIIYIACLIPLPLFVLQLGMIYAGTMTVMGIIWFILALRGYVVEDTVKWARVQFVYSLVYLTVAFLLAVVVTSPFFLNLFV